MVTCSQGNVKYIDHNLLDRVNLVFRFEFANLWYIRSYLWSPVVTAYGLLLLISNINSLQNRKTQMLKDVST